MLNNKIKILIILIVVLISVLSVFLFLAKNQFKSSRTIIITIDDVSPIHNLEKHEKLFSILDKYNITATLFVIPNYLGKHPISDGGKWIDLIKKEKSKGYEVAQHGYEHTPYEFGLLDYNQAREKLLLGRKLIEDTFGPICGFRAPYWTENYEVRNALRDLGYCYDANTYALRFEHGWKTNLWITEFLKTEAEYEIVSHINKPFIIVLHVEAMNNQGYKYLDEFLNFVTKRNVIFKNYRDVYSDK